MTRVFKYGDIQNNSLILRYRAKQVDVLNWTPFYVIIYRSYTL